jgi:hypothetical protein
MPTIPTRINELISCCFSHQVSTERFLERSQQGNAGYRGQAFHTVGKYGICNEMQVYMKYDLKWEIFPNLSFVNFILSMPY